jgi:hypothetical protein
MEVTLCSLTEMQSFEDEVMNTTTVTPKKSWEMTMRLSEIMRQRRRITSGAQASR